MSNANEFDSGTKWFSIGTCKKVAKDQLRGRWTTPVLATLIITAIIMVVYCGIFPMGEYFSLVLNGISGYDIYNADAFVKSAVLGMMPRIWLSTLLIYAFSFIANLAYIKIHIRMFKTSDNQTLGQFFGDFKFWWKAIRAGLWQGLWVFLWELAIMGSAFVVLLPLIIWIVASAQSFAAVGVFAFFMVIVYIYVLVALLWKTYQYSMHYFIIAENDNIGVIDALKVSRRMTKGYKWNLFVLDISFFGWFILCGMTFGILSLWINPYYFMARTNAFMYIKMKDEENFGKAKFDSELSEQGSFVKPEISENTSSTTPTDE